MDTRYEAHSFADPLFYDSPVRWGAPEEFAVVHQEPPSGWQRADRGIWVGLHPIGVELPDQGWKIHVSAGLANAERVLATVSEYCLRERVSFKFLRGLPVLQLQNAKYASRSASGKFCTLYPVDERQLEHCLTELGAALEGEQGPYILSDLRWQRGPLYLRYGAFVERWLRSEGGALELAFTDPEGTLVPDVRAPMFEVPSWAPVPDFLRPAIEGRKAARTGNLPYRIERALHFSNAGGIYLAEDQETGARVVLKEARPFAGLDQRGTDAPTRLHHECAMLELLAGVPQVPALLGRRTAWEHEFMVQEYVEGETLNSWLTHHYPLVHPDPAEDEIADYTAEALALLTQIEAGLAEIHARGVVFGDLHPHNLMVRPDRSVAFIDFELASRMDDFVQPALGAAGFAAPGLTGPQLDLHALAAIKLWFFLPLQQLLMLDPGKAADLAEAAARRFPLPADFVASIQAALTPVQDPPATATRASGAPASDKPASDKPASNKPASDKPAANRRTAPGITSTATERARLAALLSAPEPNWPALRDSIAAGIRASAAPERTDRLFPGDIAQFEVDALGLSYGAAGVLYALHVTGAGADPAHLRWLVEAERRRAPRAGLYTGSHGVAYTLDLLGEREAARELLDCLLSLPLGDQGDDLSDGLPGTVLTLLHFTDRTGEVALLDRAWEAADLLTERQRKSPPADSGPIGLHRGGAGQALAYLRLLQHTGDPQLLDLAEQALDRDLTRCVTAPDGSLQVQDGQRLLPYLEQGSTGIGLVLEELLSQRPDSPLARSAAPIHRSAEAEFVIQPNLFNGRAGLILYLDRLRHARPDAGIDELIDRHRKSLAWHLIPYQHQLAFPGEQLLRLSMDLATGSAGVLLALGAALADTAGLPMTSSLPIPDRLSPPGQLSPPTRLPMSGSHRVDPAARLAR